MLCYILLRKCYMGVVDKAPSVFYNTGRKTRRAGYDAGRKDVEAAQGKAVEPGGAGRENWCDPAGGESLVIGKRQAGRG